MKAIVILDSEIHSTHPMEAVLERRGYVVYRGANVAEVVALCKGKIPIDLAIAEVPLDGSGSQTEAAVAIRRSCPELPLLLVSDTPLEQWSEEDFGQFEKLLPSRIDMLLKPLTQASFVAKTNALLYTVSYVESRKVFHAAAGRRGIPATAQ